MEFDYQSLGSNAEISKYATESNDAASFMANLKDDHKSSILNAFKGKSYNANGDIVNEKNEVVITSADFHKNFKEYVINQSIPNPNDLESIDIGGTTYKINDKGEAIDTTGKVIKTRDELVQLLKNAQEQPDDVVELDKLFGEASVLTGFEFVDDTGSPISFEPTIEGIAKRDNYLVDKYGRQVAITALNHIFESKPALKELYEHIELHGTHEGFAFGQQKLNIQLEANNEAQHREIIIRGQMEKGNSKEIAEHIAKAFIDDGKGLEQAKIELATLNAKIDAIAANRARQVEAKQQAEREMQLKTYNAIKDTLSSGKIGDVPVPSIIKTKDKNGNLVSRSRDEFLSYYTTPVKDGKSQYEIDSSSKSLNDKLIDALLLFTNNSKESLIASAAQTQAIKFVRKSVASSSSHSQQRATGGTKVDITKIKL